MAALMCIHADTGRGRETEIHMHTQSPIYLAQLVKQEILHICVLMFYSHVFSAAFRSSILSRSVGSVKHSSFLTRPVLCKTLNYTSIFWKKKTHWLSDLLLARIIVLHSSLSAETIKQIWDMYNTTIKKY